MSVYPIQGMGSLALVRYTEGGRELDRAAKQIVQCIEEDRACRLDEQKMDLLYHLLKAQGHHP